MTVYLSQFILRIGSDSALLPEYANSLPGGCPHPYSDGHYDGLSCGGQLFLTNFSKFLLALAI